MSIDKLDRMELDDAGRNPQAIARAIHQQLGTSSGSVAVHEIAKALDIVEIRANPLTSFEGALLTTPERACGSILVNKVSSYRRQRFTVAHELGHFLNPWHRPTSSHGFSCSRQDMRLHNANDADRHRRQEAEANTFAIELLAPLTLVAAHLRSQPDLQEVCSMSEQLDISKAAAARRYTALHEECLALVFSHQNRFQFADRNPEFPWVDLTEGQLLPGLPAASSDVGTSDIEEGDDHDWFGKTHPGELLIQTLYQQDNYEITLLQLNSETDSDEADTREDTFDRFLRYSSDSQD